jgi:hypothetical protein
MEQSLPTPFSFRRFFLRSWLWNLLFSTVFTLGFSWCYLEYRDLTATRPVFLTNLALLAIVWVHALLLLIFSLRRFFRKELMAGGCFFVQFMFSVLLGYYLYIIIALFGWAYAMKGH